MIPKIIHYIWLGNSELPELSRHCIKSWKKYCPDYKIIKWDETNSDISKYLFAKEAYKEKKWSFVSDVLRLETVYKYGGVYMDTDVELIKPIDSLLSNSAFISFESEKFVNSGNILAAEKNNKAVKAMLEKYENHSFYNADGSLNTSPSPEYNTNALLSFGLKQNNTYQQLETITVYPTEYFCPKSLNTGIINITNKTYGIHHFDGAWLTEDSRNLNELKQKIHRLFGNGKIAKFAIFFSKVFIIRTKSIKRRIKKDGMKVLLNNYFIKLHLARKKRKNK